MRGYEGANFPWKLRVNKVPNPHEGLWAWFGKWGRSFIQGSKSPWGVMRRIRKSLYRMWLSFQIPMRGYEADSPALSNPSFQRSKSPWGVMRKSGCALPMLEQGFQIPMRGYEITEALIEGSAITGSKSPWGVMRHSMHRGCVFQSQFQIPMRGYEDPAWILYDYLTNVPNPHEGLWALVNVEETFVVTGSKSPWGVMRFSVDLHIPYLSSSKSPWGVMSPVDWACSICFSSSKSPWGVMSCNYVQCGRIVHKFQIPMRGYEHDCSVRMAEVPQFQIPMRGYEDFYFTHNFRTSAVPNPHEGLWGLFRFRSIKHTASSKSPWGVMRRRSEFLDHATKVFQIPMRGYEDWSA